MDVDACTKMTTMDAELLLAAYQEEGVSLL